MTAGILNGNKRKQCHAQWTSLLREKNVYSYSLASVHAWMHKYMHVWKLYTVYLPLGVRVSLEITPQVERNKYKETNEWKATKVHIQLQAQCFSIPFPVWEDFLEFDTFIIEVSTVKALRSRANPWRLHGVIHLPSMHWTYTGYYSGHTS